MEESKPLYVGAIKNNSNVVDGVVVDNNTLKWTRPYHKIMLARGRFLY